ncbi:MAG: glycosyltransferase [Acidimicrobiia bacterium]
MPTQATAVIVHWNQAASCIDTAARFGSSTEIDRVIVVDNGSSTGQLVQLRAGLDPEAEVIEIGRNSGFGPGANRGWELWLDDPQGSQWSIVAPHDVEFDDDTLSKLLDEASARPTLGLLSADVGDGGRPIVDHVFGPISVPATSEGGYESVDYPHGTMMLAGRSCLEAIGLFDERYFAYCEEADLGLRAQAAGFDVGLLRGARVYNPHVNTAAPTVDYLKERNTVILVSEHFGVHKGALRFALTLWQFVTGTLMPSRRGPYWSTRARGMAILDIVRRRWGRPPDKLFNLAAASARSVSRAR